MTSDSNNEKLRRSQIGPEQIVGLHDCGAEMEEEVKVRSIELSWIYRNSTSPRKLVGALHTRSWFDFSFGSEWDAVEYELPHGMIFSSAYCKKLPRISFVCTLRHCTWNPRNVKFCETASKVTFSFCPRKTLIECGTIWTPAIESWASNPSCWGIMSQHADMFTLNDPQSQNVTETRQSQSEWKIIFQWSCELSTSNHDRD